LDATGERAIAGSESTGAAEADNPFFHTCLFLSGILFLPGRFYIEFFLPESATNLAILIS
jgi:hypothetical protein